MKYINIRQFQRDLYGSIKELPLIVTRKGIQLFKVLPVKDVVTNEENKEDVVTITKES